jgi:transketolase
MLANHQKLDNLIAFVDENKKQLDGYTVGINALGDIAAKFRSFGWHAVYIDGHDPVAIYKAIEKAKQVKGQPSVIVLDTIKGHGYDFVAEAEANHHMKFGKAEDQRAGELISMFEEQLKNEDYDLI